MSEHHPWYSITDIDRLDSPAFVIYLDRVKENIRKAIARVGDVQRLRPHVKTHKSADVTRLMRDAGITKFKCATIAEAEMLGAAGAPDVLLAYQPVGPKIKRFLELVTRYPNTLFSCLIDNETAVKQISEAAAEKQVTLSVYIDMNVGMNRTGITAANAGSLLAIIADLSGVKLAGLHAYDGHITDRDLAVRTQRCSEAFAPVLAFKKALLEKGLGPLSLVAGGSPTFPIHAVNKEVECSPGTFVYWDDGYQQAFPEQAFQPAALVISRVVSFPGEGLICCDLGHKSVAAENPIQRRVTFINAMDLEAVSQSEEHLVLRGEGDHSFGIGDVLYGLPFHVCPTCALYESVYVIEKGYVVGEWKTVARDRKITL